MFVYNPFGYFFHFVIKRYQITVKRILTRNKNPVLYYPQGSMQLMKTGIKINEHTHQTLHVYFISKENQIDFIIVADITP